MTKSRVVTRKHGLVFLKYFLINGYVGLMTIWLLTEFASRSLLLWLALHIALITLVSVVCVLMELKKWRLRNG